MEPLEKLPEPSGFVPEFTLGDRLRRARESTGYTQNELAGLVGVSQRSISSYEADDTVPNAITITLWALYTQVSLPWLAWGDATAAVPTSATWRPKRMRVTRPPTIWSHGYRLRGVLPGIHLVAAEG